MKPTSILQLVWTSSLLTIAGQAAAYDCSTLANWSQQQVYKKGALIQTQNQAFEAKWYSQNEDPTTYSGPYDVWKNLGICSSGQDHPPSITLTSPNDGAVLGENDSAVLSADASDIDGDLSYVEFLVDGQSIAVDNTPPFQATWRAALGEHSVSAIATDAQGHSTASRSATISVKAKGTNLPPAVSVNTPTNGQQFYQSDIVNIDVAAEDTDGSITEVIISANSETISTLTAPPFQVQWQALPLGITQLNVKVRDNQGLISEANVAIEVLSKTAGGCQGLRSYRAGQSYRAGELVAHNNHKYRCDVSGWCSSNALWAYEPGTGQHWRDAWSDLDSALSHRTSHLRLPTIIARC